MKIVTLARKPMKVSITDCVVDVGVGALNIDGCRISTSENLNGGAYSEGPRKGLPGDLREGPSAGMFAESGRLPGRYEQPSGRWPANVIFQHESDCGRECEPTCSVQEVDQQGQQMGSHSAGSARKAIRNAGKKGLFPMDGDGHRFGDEGGVGRFFKQVQGKESGERGFK